MCLLVSYPASHLIGGGGGCERLPSLQPESWNISESKAVVDIKLGMPLPETILHILTKHRVRWYDNSAENDVRVT